MSSVDVCVDLTDDFTSLLVQARSKKGEKEPLAPARSVVPSASPFNALASSVARALAGTYEKLARLTELAKSTNMSFDPAEQIDRLSRSIKEDIARMKSELQTLEERRAATEARANAHETAHSRTVLKALSLRLQLAKQQFTGVLERRKVNLKRAFEKRRELFGDGGGSLARRKVDNPLYRMGAAGATSTTAAATTTSATAAAASTTASPLPAATQPLPSAAAADAGAGAASADVALTMPQMSLQLEVAEESRAHAIENIQQTIMELGQIFDQVNLLVSQQGELVERIDSNVEQLEGNVSHAQRQLIKHWESLTSSRWLTAKLVLIAAVFVIVWLVFLV